MLTFEHFWQGLTHRNVVRYHDVFLHMDGGLMQVCTVMEFCRSGDLAQHLLTLKEGSETVDEPNIQLLRTLTPFAQRKGPS